MALTYFQLLWPHGDTVLNHIGVLLTRLRATSKVLPCSFWSLPRVAQWWIRPGFPFQPRSLKAPRQLSANSLSILISFSPLSSLLLSGPWRSAQGSQTQSISTEVHQWDFHYVSRCHHWELRWFSFQELNKQGVLGIPGSPKWKPLLIPLFPFSISQIVSPGSKGTLPHLHWFLSLPLVSDSGLGFRWSSLYLHYHL